MTDFWQDDPELARTLESVAGLMDRALDSPEFPLREAVASLVDSNGKLLRPALVVIGSRFGRADERRILPLAASVELLHVSTLIHDDVIDEATIRRGIPTLHTRLGVKEAVLAGDWLLSRSFKLSAESASDSNAMGLARVIGAICASEIQQDLDKWRYSASVRAYLRKISGKTAALLSLALFVGAAEAKVQRRVAERLRRAGYDIGMAFQIIDDILDFESSEGVMRKPVGHDLEEGLCTLPLIYALRADEAGFRPLLAKLRKPDGKADPELLAAILSRCAEVGGVEAARRDAARYTSRAQAEIAGLPDCAARDELARVADRLLDRSY